MLHSCFQAHSWQLKIVTSASKIQTGKYTSRGLNESCQDAQTYRLMAEALRVCCGTWLRTSTHCFSQKVFFKLPSLSGCISLSLRNIIAPETNTSTLQALWNEVKMKNMHKIYEDFNLSECQTAALVPRKCFIETYTGTQQYSLHNLQQSMAAWLCIFFF